MTRQGRKVGAIVSILGGIYMLLISFINYSMLIFFDPTLIDLTYIWIVAFLGILGGVLLIEDWTFGGGLSLGVGTMLLCFVLLDLFFSRELGPIHYLVGAALIGPGGFIGVMIGSEPHFSPSNSELELIDEWIETKEIELVKTYKVGKMEFFDRLWGGLVFSVEFLKDINPKSIKKLIEFLELNWGGKVFIMTKTGLDETKLASNEYIFYQKEGGHLNYKLEEVNLND
jgi:hypothetical protein